jgi:hypothetical protein
MARRLRRSSVWMLSLIARPRYEYREYDWDTFAKDATS